MLEWVDGPSLSSLVQSGFDCDALGVICELLPRVHIREGVVPGLFDSLERRFQSLFRRAEKEERGSIFSDCLDVAQRLIKTEESRVLLHGDIHHGNILKSSERGWVAIDPQPLVGERTYDLANTFFNPIEMSDVIQDTDRIRMIAETFSSHLEIDPTRVLQFAYAHGGLSASWMLDDSQDPAVRLKITSLIGALLKRDIGF